MGIGMGILLSVVTLGIYSLFWQNKQIEAVNAWLGRREFNFFAWLLFSILTLGIYALYHEYLMGTAINEIQAKHRHHVNRDLPLLSVVLALFGVWVGSLAIQQIEINRLYAEHQSL